MECIHFSTLDTNEVKSLRVLLHVTDGDGHPILLKNHWFQQDDHSQTKRGTRLVDVELAFIRAAIHTKHEATFTSAYSKLLTR